MCAGDFLQVTKDDDFRWSAVVTVFFIDTAMNVIEYIETIHRLNILFLLAYLVQVVQCFVSAVTLRLNLTFLYYMFLEIRPSLLQLLSGNFGLIFKKTEP